MKKDSEPGVRQAAFDCGEVRPVLGRVAEREANPEEAILTARHLSDCTACRILLARERRLASMLEQDLEDEVHVGEDFVKSVMANLPAEPPPDPRPRKKRVLKLAGLAALLGGLQVFAASRSVIEVAFGSSWSAPSPTLPGAEGAFEGLTRVGNLVGLLLNSITAGLPGLLRPLGGIDPLVVLAPAALAALLGSVAVLALAARTLVSRDGLGS